MRRLGNIISLYGQSCIIIKSEYNLKKKANFFLNLNILNKNMKIIGKINSIFGSENQIYFLAKIYKNELILIKKKYFENYNEYKIYIEN